MDATSSDMKAVLDAAQDRSPRIIAEHGRFFLARNTGYDNWHAEDITEKVEQAKPVPDRTRGTSEHGSLASFIAHVGKAGSEGTVAYADPDRPQVVAVYNYWGGWRDYRAIWTCDLSPEFETWQKIDRRYVDQIAFAEFLLENIGDVLSADGTDAAGMLEAARDLEINRDVAFASRIDLISGAARFKYEDTDKTAGQLLLPKEFSIGVPIFTDDSGPVEIRCQLRYRVKEGNLTLGIVMLPPPKTLIRRALDAALVEIRAKAGIEVYVGTPES